MAGTKLPSKNYFLATVHRPGNTDDPEKLRRIFNVLAELSWEAPVLVPLHPRTRETLKELASELGPALSRLQIIEPVGYFDMLWLEKHARAILTDSGGIQKEAYWLGVPCITLRDETEWHETVAAGANILAGTNPELILQAAKTPPVAVWQTQAFGDGHAAQRIISILLGTGPCGTRLTRGEASIHES